jgi:hypothetical protein
MGSSRSHSGRILCQDSDDDDDDDDDDYSGNSRTNG